MTPDAPSCAEVKIDMEIKNLTVSYGRVKAVRGVNLTLKQGQVIAVLGANGAGKSSLLRAIIGVEAPSAGSIYFNGVDITSQSTPARVAGGIVLVPENRRILIDQTIHENLLLGATARQDAENFEADADAVYERFPSLRARKDLAAACLSGGEQQMLAIGRALMARPKLLMLDEPSLGLSPIIVNQMFGLLKDLNEQGLSILLVEQNTGKALALAHRAYVMEQGAIAISGKSSEILSDPRLKEAYLGGE